MKRAMRWIVPVVGVAAVAVLFFVLRPSEDSSELYNSVDKLIPKLIAEDFEKDEKQRA